jgi:hypothetical protein
MVGGCCGTGPAHIKLIAEMTKGLVPRKVPLPRGILAVSGNHFLIAFSFLLSLLFSLSHFSSSFI